jgi:lysyl-tRNA synthetase class 2
LQLRAKLLARVRQYFAERDVLEVETPLLGHAIGTDPQLAFFTTQYHFLPEQQTLFMQTSPEFAMKRLLAANSGSIYQICKAFRNGESGRFHNPEFSILEWYRVGFNLCQLMDDCADLLAYMFDGKPISVERLSYPGLFQRYTGLNALEFSFDDYCHYVQQEKLSEAIDICQQDHATWLDFIFSHRVQPNLGHEVIHMVYDYPACFSSLARLNPNNHQVLERVELFINGVELGNGYYELSNAKEQSHRFDHEMLLRKQNNLPEPVKDLRLIEALSTGLPDCSGMAIGLDRLLMVLADMESIDQVIAFPVNIA